MQSDLQSPMVRAFCLVMRVYLLVCGCVKSACEHICLWRPGVDIGRISCITVHPYLLRQSLTELRVH